MRTEGTIWAFVIVVTMLLAVLIGIGASGVGIVILSVLGLVAYTTIGWSMSRPVDRSWLPRWVMLGFLAKVAGTLARYYMLVVLYDSGGDAVRYYQVGRELANTWATGRLPRLTGSGGFGTQVTEAITGALFAVFTPDMLGGYMMFSLLAFGGQLLLYAAFRRWAQPGMLKLYAFFMFFLPTYAFWPSSIGKDALILLFMGLAAYAAARTFEAYELRWLVVLGLGLGATAMIRPHVAALLAAALAVTSLVARMRAGLEASAYLRRLLVMSAFGLAGVLAFTLFSDVMGIDLTSLQNVDDFAADVVRRTSESGSGAIRVPVTSPLQVPGAIAHVLFSPTVLQARNVQTLVAAGETTALMLFSLWLLPRIVRNWRQWRASAWAVFGTVYTIGFSIAFSVIGNFGIVARQRGQVLALYLAAIVIMGWRDDDQRERTVSNTVAPMAAATPMPTARQGSSSQTSNTTASTHTT